MVSKTDILINYLTSLVKTSETELAAFLKIVSFQDVEKGKCIIQQKNSCNRMYFVLEGFLKYVLPIKEKALVVHIATVGDLVTDFYAYYSSKPSTTSVYTLSDCSLAYVKKEELEELYANFKVWEKFGRLVAEEAAVKQVMERIKLQTMSTEEIYLDFIQRKPELLQHVKLGDLAQTFGVSQETLSRIRRRISDKS
ncbi:MAG: Crp/Fnr family transcriptional regulator [Bacteroidota bacterium]